MSHLHRTYIQLIQWAPLSFLERECSYLAEWFPMVYCLFDLILFIPVNIISVKSYQDGSSLGWPDTKQDLMCLACHAYLLQPCGHLLGKGWPLGSLVCDVFLLFLSLSHTIPCPGSCVLIYCIDSLPLPSSLLCHEQYAVPPVRLKPATLLLDSSILPLGTALAYCAVNRWKFQITAMTLE